MPLRVVRQLLQGSHVMRFGTLDIDQEPVANFMGQENTGGPEGCEPVGGGCV